MKLIIVLFCTLYTAQVFSQAKPCPCCTEEYKKFDFWAGNWTVSVNGKLAGTNDIYYTQDSCILLENWKSAGKYTGTSMNYYDASDKTWNQLWIDNQGAALKLKGQFDGASMVLMSSPTVNDKNQIVINKITWTPQENGSVRQLWESTQDGGKEWSVLFDGMYVRNN